MAMTTRQWREFIQSLAPVPETPAIRAARDKRDADLTTRRAQERNAVAEAKRIREIRNERTLAISAALMKWHQQERRQGSSPDAAIVESAARTTPTDEHEDTELHCAKCDGVNITLGARHGIDEFGIEDSEDMAWCWDCSSTTEPVEIALPASVLARIHAAVAA